MSSCSFTYYCLIFSSFCSINYILFKIAESSFSIYFTFIMMNVIAFIAFLCFSLFLPKLVDLLGKQGQNFWALEFSFTG